MNHNKANHLPSQIYILSGLGADERVFQLLDFSGMEVVFIKWISPEKNEKIEAYAKRLCAQITTEKPILIGLSFGGMMAIEISKIIPTEKIILLSSVKTKHELPMVMRVMGKLGLDSLVPPGLIKRAHFLGNYIFGLHSIFEKRLFQLILLDMDSEYLKWAIRQVHCWQNESIPPNLSHIHGSADRIFPIQRLRVDYTIADGGHFMVLSKHKAVSKIIRAIIFPEDK